MSRGQEEVIEQDVTATHDFDPVMPATHLFELVARVSSSLKAASEAERRSRGVAYRT